MYASGLAEGGAIPPQVAVGGRLAETLSFGDAPGYPGYFQVNFARSPSAMTAGVPLPVRLMLSRTDRATRSRDYRRQFTKSKNSREEIRNENPASTLQVLLLSY